uniref:Molybdate-anion transporter n=1 Tax=Glycine max TaxID=3847 RepID=C6TGE8_SOYBN|nr:unknown [Glycine max]
MELFFYAVFGGLGAVVAVTELSKSNKDRINTSSAFNSFKNNYLIVYSLMMAGDWLQGPYVYYLYSTYGYGKGDIGQLFIAGFGSSMLFGTIVGSLADKQGRKRACVTYCITYILSCITKHSPHYKVLMLGRILGGIATSLLFSAFESWLVAEHFKRGFDQQWLSLTFSKAIFLGNGLVAILSGLFGNVLVDTLALGPVAPFDAASCFLAIGMAIILSSWFYFCNIYVGFNVGKLACIEVDGPFFTPSRELYADCFCSFFCCSDAPHFDHFLGSSFWSERWKHLILWLHSASWLLCF